MSLEKEKLKFYNHCFLATDGKRAHLRLTGKIMVLTALMEYSDMKWDITAQNEYRGACKKACQEIQASASERGIPLEFNQCYFQVTLPENSQIDIVKPSTWGKLLLKGFHCKDFPEMARFYQMHFQCDEVLILTAFNVKGRSFVSLSSENTYFKSNVTVICAGENTHLTSTIAHEILHLFGAKDMYYPKEVKAAAEKYLKKSVMLANMKKPYIDDLTAYLIGWRNTLSDDAFFMLNEIRNITPQMLHE